MEIKMISPIKISQGDLWATKTYVHDFVESPDGSKILYRYFPKSDNQPPNLTDMNHGAQMWMCAADGSNHRMLFEIPLVWRESGHGSESMVWLDNDRFYYNGILFSTFENRIVWFLPNPVDERREISAWSFPARKKLFINIRTGLNAGYYWIDPYGDNVPELHPVIGRDEMLTLLGGDSSTYQFTYIFLSTGGSHLYFVMYFNNREWGFTSKEDGTDIVPVGNNDMRLKPWNGHTIWFDDDHLVYPCYPEAVAKYCDRFGNDQTVVGGKSNHITVSPDKKWLVSDSFSVVRLFRYGSTEVVAELMTDAEKPLPDSKFHTHPSFSRDSKRIYFIGRNGALAAVYCADISSFPE